MVRPTPFPDDASARPEPGTRVLDQHRRGRVWEADGSGWQPLDVECEQECNGLGLEYSRNFLAIYASEGSIWIQVGRRAWDASQIARVTLIGERMACPVYRIDFVTGAMEMITLRLPRTVVAPRMIDATRLEIATIAAVLRKGFRYTGASGWNPVQLLSRDDSSG